MTLSRTRQKELQKLKLELFREGFNTHYHDRDEIETATAWRP